MRYTDITQFLASFQHFRAPGVSARSSQVDVSKTERIADRGCLWDMLGYVLFGFDR